MKRLLCLLCAALLLTETPTLTPEQIRTVLCDMAQDIGNPGWDTSSGWGILEVG